MIRTFVRFASPQERSLAVTARHNSRSRWCRRIPAWGRCTRRAARSDFPRHPHDQPAGDRSAEEVRIERPRAARPRSGLAVLVSPISPLRRSGCGCCRSPRSTSCSVSRPDCRERAPQHALAFASGWELETRARSHSSPAIQPRGPASAQAERTDRVQPRRGRAVAEFGPVARGAAGRTPERKQTETRRRRKAAARPSPVNPARSFLPSLSQRC